jgi:hypothetical protein
MRYPDGQEVHLGDRVEPWNGNEGTVVCSVDTEEYSLARTPAGTVGVPRWRRVSFDGKSGPYSLPRPGARDAALGEKHDRIGPVAADAKIA